MANKFHKKKLNVALQLSQLKGKFPIKNIIIRGGFISWNLDIQPTPLSKIYTASCEYQIGKSPLVYLKNQGILSSEQDKPPHCYERVFKSPTNEYVRLCLYYPGIGEWDSDMLISDTIIPWLVEWLYYYEIWRITDKWYGGGHEVAKKDKR